MFIRRSSVKRHGKTYEYAQLVESVRKGPGGRPVHRVIANLGRVTDERMIENLRAAFEGNRNGHRVARVVDGPTSAALPQPRACLRYLDVAVVVETLRSEGVLQDLERLLPRGQSDVAPHRIIAALVAQRCLDPQSKLHAVRWFPRTALSELLGLSPEQFNNSRLHRVLDMLEGAEQDLMRGLSRRIIEREGPLRVAFLDLSDTYFEGSGPKMALKGKSKEGLIRKKVGIALLCSPSGLPLRWRVVAGNRAEPPTMLEMMRNVQLMPWLADTPIVMDRAMGYTAYIRQMLDTGARFITALTASEYETYCPTLPAADLLDLGASSEKEEAACADEAARRIQALGFKQLADNQFCLDVGLRDLPESKEPRRESERKLPSFAMQFARDVEEAVACGKYGSYAAAGRSLGQEKNLTNWYRKLLKLPEDLQQSVLAGEVDSAAIHQVIDVAKLDETQCREAFAHLLKLHREAPVAPANPAPAQPSTQKVAQVRCAAYFNPEAFASQRRLAAEKLADIEAYVRRLNEGLMQTTGRTKARSVRRKIEEQLRRRDLVSAFHIDIEENSVAGRSWLQAKVTLDQREWQRRRRFDGFTVVIADPRVELGADELCRTYRAKDVVETDFHVIKSLIKLRPVWHHTDLKVRAHVTLCMLALLVQRRIGQQLSRRGLSAQLAFELLEPCRLSVHQPSARSRPAYVLTQATPEQLRILRRLGLARLADEAEVSSALLPRASFVTTAGEERA